MTTTLRATTSASNFPRRVRCLGSHWAEHGLPEENSEFSEEGQLLHFALNPANKVELSPEQADLVATASASITEAITRTIAAFNIPGGEPYEEGYENALSLRKGIRIVMPGHVDYFRYWPALKLLFIADAKFGYVEVAKAPVNLQLRGYAAMGSQEWDVDNAVVAIAQPRAYAIEGAEALTTARYDRADLALSVRQIQDWEPLWLAKDAPRVPSEDACKYCKAALICPERNARMSALSTGLPMSLADLDAEQFSDFYAKMTLASNAAAWEKMKAEARIRIAEGRMPGYRLEENAPRRSITGQEKAASLLCSELGFTDAELAAVSKIAIGQVETMLRTKNKADKMTAVKAKQAVNAALASVIELTTPEPSIVAISEHDAIKTLPAESEATAGK